MPTATDLIVVNNKTLQVIVATTPKPVLYWDDNNGHKSSLNILTVTSFPVNSTVYLDDIALTYNSTGTIYAYITCRVLLTNNTTEIHLLTFEWQSFTNIFQLAPFATLQDTRPTTTDPFDAVKIDARGSDNIWTPFNGELAFVYSKNGSVYGTWGTVNFANGSLTGVQANQFIMAGAKPDVAMTYGQFAVNQTLGSFYVAAINGNTVNVKDKLGLYNGSVYTSNNTIRSLSLDDAGIGAVVAINETDNTNKKSYVKIIHSGLYNTYYPVTIADANNNQEQNCNNNSNFNFTGYPVVKSYFYDFHGYMYFDLVWQQVFCNGTDFCTIQAISKRYYRIGINSAVTSYNNNQFIYLSNDLTRNSFFPSVNANGLGRVGYSFAFIDKNTSNNGLVAYKSTSGHLNTAVVNPNDDILRAALTENVKSEKPLEFHRNDIAPKTVRLFPNPVTDWLIINSKEFLQKIVVYSMEGNLMQIKDINAANSAKINLKYLPNGQYLLKIFTKSGAIENRKIIKN
jgi:hypothetical protein